MSSRASAQEFARRLHAVAVTAEIARKAAARELALLGPLDGTELLHHLLTLSREGFEPARCALSFVAAALTTEAAKLPHAHALRRLANLQDLTNVAALFPEGAPAQQLDPQAAKKADALKFSETLGLLKTKARLTRNPDELTRIATASEPSVVRNVLLNPRLTEAVVIRIAARRPARPEPLIEIWKSPKWGVRHEVRRALALNPYLPPEVGAKIIPLLSTADLKDVAAARDLHPSLRDQAQALLAVDDRAL